MRVRSPFRCAYVTCACNTRTASAAHVRVRGARPRPLLTLSSPTASVHRPDAAAPAGVTADDLEVDWDNPMDDGGGFEERWDYEGDEQEEEEGEEEAQDADSVDNEVSIRGD